MKRALLLGGMLTLLAASVHADPCVGARASQYLAEPFQNLAENVDPVIKYELGAGYTHFSPAPNGIWYQQGFPYDLHMNSKSYSAGVVAKIDKNTKVRAGFQYLGKTSSNAVATASDQNYDICRNDHSRCWPLSHWYGKGDVSEFYLTLDHTVNFKGTHVILEGGLTAYRATWTETIPDWLPSATSTPRYLQVVHNPRLQPGLEMGAGVELGQGVSLMYTLQSTMARGDGWPGIYKGLSQNFSLRKEF